MLASDIRDLSEADVRSRIAELEEELFRLKFRSATETLESPLKLRHLRKDVARLNTVLREKQLAAPKQSSGAPASRSKRPAKRARR
jgi:large subunit ribosomal protein L29